MYLHSDYAKKIYNPEKKVSIIIQLSEKGQKRGGGEEPENKSSYPLKK